MSFVEAISSNCPLGGGGRTVARRPRASTASRCHPTVAGSNATFYSDAERKLSECRKEVLGRDFFVEIAPCMNNPNFGGRIDRPMAAGRVDIAFSYIADMPSGTIDIEARV